MLMEVQGEVEVGRGQDFGVANSAEALADRTRLLNAKATLSITTIQLQHTRPARWCKRSEQRPGQRLLMRTQVDRMDQAQLQLKNLRPLKMAML